MRNNKGSILLGSLVAGVLVAIGFYATLTVIAYQNAMASSLSASINGQAYAMELAEYFRSKTVASIASGPTANLPFCKVINQIVNGSVPYEDNQGKLPEPNNLRNGVRTYILRVYDLQTLSENTTFCTHNKLVSDLRTTRLKSTERVQVEVFVTWTGAGNIGHLEKTTALLPNWDPCGNAKIIDFETLPATGLPPNQSPGWIASDDYMNIQNEFVANHGVKFCKQDRTGLEPNFVWKTQCKSSGPWVTLGKVCGGNNVGWATSYRGPLFAGGPLATSSDLCGYDQVLPENRNLVGNYFLSRNNGGTGIWIEYTAPTAAASGWALDVDSYTGSGLVTAYDLNKNVLITTPLPQSSGEPYGGDGSAKYWRIDNGGIAAIKYLSITTKDGAMAIDRFSPDGSECAP